MKSAEGQQRYGGGILHFLAVAERSKAKSFESKDTGKAIYSQFLSEIRSDRLKKRQKKIHDC